MHVAGIFFPYIGLSDQGELITLFPFILVPNKPFGHRTHRSENGMECRELRCRFFNRVLQDLRDGRDVRGPRGGKRPELMPRKLV